MRWNGLRIRYVRPMNLPEEASNPKIKGIFSFKQEVGEIYYKKSLTLSTEWDKTEIDKHWNKFPPYQLWWPFLAGLRKKRQLPRLDRPNNLGPILSS